MSSGADETVNYEINTTANLQGQKAAADGFKEVTKASEDASKKSEDAGKKDEEHGKKTHFLNLKKMELKKLIRELGHEFPIAGYAAKAMLNPLVVGLTLAIGLFVKCKQALDDWNKELDEAAEKNAQRDFLPGIEAKVAAMNEGEAAAAAFSESIRTAGSHEDAFSQSVKRATDRLHEFVAAQAEVNSATEANELAKVNLDEKLGRVSPEKAIVQRSAIRERYRIAGEQLKTTSENAELGLKESQLQHDIQQGPALEADALKKMGEENDLQSRLARSKADLPKAKERLDELLKIQTAAQAERDAAQGAAAKPAQDILDLPRYLAAQQNAKVASKKAASAEGDYNRQKKLVAGLQQDVDEIPTKLLPKVSSEAAIAKELATKNAQDIVRLQQEVPALKEALAIRQDARAVVSDIKSGTATMDAQAELLGTEKGKQVAGVIKTADTIRAGEAAKSVRGRRLTDEEMADIQKESGISSNDIAVAQTVVGAVNKSGSAVGGGLKQIADAVQSATGGQVQTIDSILRLVESQERINASHNSRIKSLETSRKHNPQ